MRGIKRGRQADDEKCCTTEIKADDKTEDEGKQNACEIVVLENVKNDNLMTKTRTKGKRRMLSFAKIMFVKSKILTQ